MKNKPDSEGYCEEYHSVFDTLYLIKLNRIARSLSPEELSFLIGRPANYLESKEGLFVGDLTVKDLYWIAAAFYLPPTMIFMRKSHMDKKIKVKVSKVKQHGIISHIAEMKDGIRAPKLLFKLYEYKTPLTKKDKEKNAQQLSLLIKTIGNLLQQAYFNKGFRRPLEIYNHCSAITKIYIRPYLLKKALNTYCAPDKKPRLKKILHAKEGFVYKKYSRKTEPMLTSET